MSDDLQELLSRAAAKVAAMITRKSMTEMLCVSARTYLFYERGNIYPPVERLIQISDILGVNIDWLLGRGDCRHVKNDNASD